MKVTYNTRKSETTLRLTWTETRQFLSQSAAVKTIREDIADAINRAYRRRTRPRIEPGEVRPATVDLDLLATALSGADGFITGFEDDEGQEGIAELLATIRAARGVVIAEAHKEHGGAAGDFADCPLCQQPAEPAAAIVARYNARLNELELSPNGDDYNALLDFLNGAPYREPLPSNKR